MPRPVIVGTPTSVGRAAGSTSLTVPKPAGLADGDLLIAFVRDQASSLASDYSCGGFTRRGPAYVPADATNRVNGIFTKRVTTAASEPASYVFTTATPGARAVIGMITVRNTDPVTPVSVASTSYAGTAATGGKTATTLTVPDVDSLAIFFGASEFAAPNAHTPNTTPSGMTVAVAVSTDPSTAVSRTYLWAGAQDVDAGPTGDKTITWPVASGAAAQMVVLGPGPTPGVDPLGSPVEVSSGTTGQPAQLTVWDGAIEGDVRDILGLPRKTYTVAEHHADLAVKGKVRWAHRGGSLNWPEMSMRAYTNAIWHGCDVLEASCWKTTDGVFVMVHDNDLSISTTGTGNVTAQTWAAIKDTPIDVPALGGGVLGRLDDLLSTYGQTKVVVVEDKQNVNRAALQAVIESHYPSPAIAREHVIVKVYGGNAGGLDTGAAWEAAGYRVWAYFYDAEITTATSGKVTPISYLGMNHNAVQANYDAALAYGKPVIAHIVSSQAQVDAALTKGAMGLQVSNVLDLVPRVNIIP